MGNVLSPLYDNFALRNRAGFENRTGTEVDP
jgi:hypothetical protein